MNSKPIDELTIDDLKNYKIWQWALDEEENEAQDETWVTPAATDNFTSDLNGSIVLGTLYINANQTMPIMCSLDVTTDEVSIDSVIVYKKEGDDYLGLEDMIHELTFPVTIEIDITLNKQFKALRFTVNKVDVYRNQIKASLL
ncbi:hypothetical protein NIZ91_10240 [Bacillus sp. 1780r2a1]|nr:hypothetical protein NIZ91_10240 [Bacillus sp. 1780r2a1]